MAKVFVILLLNTNAMHERYHDQRKRKRTLLKAKWYL